MQWTKKARMLLRSDPQTHKDDHLPEYSFVIDQSGHIYYAYYDARDLSGIIVYEFFHVAGFSDAAARPFIHQIQVHCGNPSSVL